MSSTTETPTLNVEETVTHSSLWQKKDSHNERLIEFLEKAVTLSKDEEVNKILFKCLTMATGLEVYLETTSPPETPLQKKIYDDTMTERWEERFEKGEILYPYRVQMMSSRHAASFGKTIVEIVQAERILEIGLFTGYAAAAFCDVKCVKSVTSLEIDPSLVDFTMTRFAGTEEEKKLKVMTGDASETLEKLKTAGETFDLVFIDAEKSSYLDYYNFIMDNDLIRSGGVFILDNTLWKGEVYPVPAEGNAQAVAQVNAFIKDDPRVTQIVLQIGDGVTLVRRR